MLLASGGETALLPLREQAVPAAPPRQSKRLAQARPATRRMLLLTLLFLGVAGLRRTWDLRGYTGDGLALLTGRQRAYGYRHVERFLSALAQAGGAESLTDALAQWTSALWPPSPQGPGAPLPTFYLDGHRKAVYTDGLIPRGLVARRGAILGCRALLVLHDAAGHPLLATTHRGDTHLTLSAAALLARYEQAAGLAQVRRVVVDREGMAAAFLRDLVAEGRVVVTVLRSDQYNGLASFTEVGPFVPLRADRHGTVVREVAPARYALALPDDPTHSLDLRVALIRDVTRQVPCAGPTSPRTLWEADHDAAGRPWWEQGWVATPSPAPPTTPKLVPIVTTAAEVDPYEMAQTYTHRWPAQENSFKDWLLPLGLDTNHGYAAVPVVNSEIAKRRTALLKRLETLRRWAERARETHERATKRYNKRWQATKEYGEVLYRDLNRRLCALETHDLLPHELRAQRGELTRAAEDEMAERWEHAQRARRESHVAFHKQERYCQEQRALLRQLEDLAARERTMQELDNRKDQVMTVLKLAVVNLVMWTRDRYFPDDYRHATWARLAPFFHLPGRIVWGVDTVSVALRPFNDRQLTRDLVALCRTVEECRPCLPDGRRLIFTVSGHACLTSDGQNAIVA